MLIKFTITRSSEWLKNQAITTGENPPGEVVVDVDSQALGEDRRRWLLDYWQSNMLYDSLDRLCYDTDHIPYYGCTRYGHEKLTSEALNPTQEDAIKALDEAIAVIGLRRAEYLLEKAEREAKQREADEEKARKDKQLADARELLKEELEGVENLRKYRKILSDVLSEFTPDELVEAIKKTGQTNNMVEEASTYTLNLD